MPVRKAYFYPLIPLWRRSLSFRVTVKHVLDSQLARENISISGWVTSVRKQKNWTFLNVSDGSSLRTLQLLVPTDTIPQARKLDMGCSVTANGNIIMSTHPLQRVEMEVTDLHVLGKCDQQAYPFKPRVRYTDEYIRRFPHLRARTDAFSSLLRVRHSTTMEIHKFFSKNGFINCHTPILSSSDCEGAGELFEVIQKDKKDFFGQSAYLTVSGQLHAEALASGMMSVYTFGPTFRAESSHTRRHLAEFYMVEAETMTIGHTRSGLASLMDLIEDLVKTTITAVLESNKEDMELFYKQAEKSQIPTLMVDSTTPFKTISYTEAIQFLLKSTERFQHEPKWGCDLHGEHEQYLVNHCGQQLPLFVTDFPAAIKPFYAKLNENYNDSKTVASVDLLVPGVGEIVGGTVREECYHVLKERLESEGLDKQYQWYLDLRKFGTIPHGGFGLGFERLLQAMLGIRNIRDVIPFPRYAGSCQF